MLPSRRIIQKNLVDDIEQHILKLMPTCSKVWATSIALATVQASMDGFYTITKKGRIYANNFYVTIGTTGCGKSVAAATTAIPILYKFGNMIYPDVEDEPKKLVVLPSGGSSEGFLSYMCKNNIKYGLIYYDEMTRILKSTKKGYQSDALEHMIRLWEGENINTITINRGLEYLEHPFISMLGTSTPVFIQGIDSDFFNMGLGTRIIWSWFDVKDATKLEPTFFDFKDDDVINEQFANQLVRIKEKAKYSTFDNDEEVLIGISDSAKEIWLNYELECNTNLNEAMIRDPTAWEYGSLSRYAQHTLKTALTYAVAESRHVISLDNMNKAISFMRDSQSDFHKIIKWKHQHGGEMMKREDFTDIAKSIYSRLKEQKIQYLTNMLLREFIVPKNEIEYVKIRNRMKELKFIKIDKAANIDNEILTSIGVNQLSSRASQIIVIL